MEEFEIEWERKEQKKFENFNIDEFTDEKNHYV
jgi:hypothetical protein